MWNLEKLSDNDGITLINGREVTYKTGYQVATDGVECKTVEEANRAIKSFGGNAGVWLSGGVYYIDKSHHVQSKKDAVLIGKLCNQQSILKWEDMSLIWLSNR